MNPLTKKKTAPTVTTVQSTTRYDKFTFLEANRGVHESHANAIKRSLSNSNWLSNAPIVVNERNQVIDGQHRLVAARELDLPIYYTVVPGLTHEDAHKMNLLHRRWNNDDYLRAYAAEGRTAYVLFKQLHEEYPRIPISLLTIFVAGNESNGVHARFRKGELELTEEGLVATRGRLEKLVQLQNLSSAFNLRSMAYAWLKAMNSDSYRHRKMVEKVQQQAADIKAFQGVADNLRQLEDVYNKHSMPVNHVRFF